MQKSDDGYVPARGFLERCMSPRPEFNDGTEVDPIKVSLEDGMLCNLNLCHVVTNTRFAVALLSAFCLPFKASQS